MAAVRPPWDTFPHGELAESKSRHPKDSEKVFTFCSHDGAWDPLALAQLHVAGPAGQMLSLVGLELVAATDLQ